MKTTTVLVLILFLGFDLFAQEGNRDQQEYRTLFGGDEITHGGYGGLSINYSQIDGKGAILVGAKGAWIINHGIGIGIGGYGFANDINYEKTINGSIDKYTLAGGYGGLLIELIIGANWPVHVSIPVLIGAGTVAYVNNHWKNYDDPDFHRPYNQDGDAFFVIEPGIEIELNMVKFMRLAIGGHYRFTSNLDLVDTKSGILNGFSTGVTLKFGKF